MLIPPPRFPLLRFGGVLGPSSSWRKRVVAMRAQAQEAVAACSRKRQATRTKKKGKKQKDVQPRGLATEDRSRPCRECPHQPRHRRRATLLRPDRLGNAAAACVSRRCPGLSVWRTPPYRRRRQRARNHPEHPRSPRPRGGAATDRASQGSDRRCVRGGSSVGDIARKRPIRGGSLQDSGLRLDRTGRRCFDCEGRGSRDRRPRSPLLLRVFESPRGGRRCELRG